MKTLKRIMRTQECPSLVINAGDIQEWTRTLNSLVFSLPHIILLLAHIVAYFISAKILCEYIVGIIFVIWCKNCTSFIITVVPLGPPRMKKRKILFRISCFDQLASAKKPAQERVQGVHRISNGWMAGEWKSQQQPVTSSPFSAPPVTSSRAVSEKMAPQVS